MAILLPPPQYDFPPPMPVIERVLSYGEVNRLCAPIVGQELSQGANWWGCSHREGGKCYVIRVDNEMVRRHELAHCNGWPGTHPGGW